MKTKLAVAILSFAFVVFSSAAFADQNAKYVQSLLKGLWFYNGEIDGSIGPATTEAMGKYEAVYAFAHKSDPARFPSASAFGSLSKLYASCVTPLNELASYGYNEDFQYYKDACFSFATLRFEFETGQLSDYLEDNADSFTRQFGACGVEVSPAYFSRLFMLAASNERTPNLMPVLNSSSIGLDVILKYEFADGNFCDNLRKNAGTDKETELLYVVIVTAIKNSKKIFGR